MGIQASGAASGYRLRFVGPNDADLKWPANQSPDDNQVFWSSNVTVTFHPGDCLITPDSWTISGTNLNLNGFVQLETLHEFINRSWVHPGQYEMPFQLEVQALRII